LVVVDVHVHVVVVVVGDELILLVFLATASDTLMKVQFLVLPFLQPSKSGSAEGHVV